MIDQEKLGEEMFALKKFFASRGLSKIEVELVCTHLVKFQTTLTTKNLIEKWNKDE